MNADLLTVRSCSECGASVSARVPICPRCSAQAGISTPDRAQSRTGVGRRRLREHTITIAVGLALGLLTALSAASSLSGGHEGPQPAGGVSVSGDAGEAVPVAPPDVVPNPDDPSTVPLGYYVGRSPSPPATPPRGAAPYQEAYPPGTVVVNAPDGRSIELRGGDSIPAGAELGRIPDGATVRVIGSCVHGDEVDGVWGHWCAVEYGGQQGWAFSPFLVSPPGT